MDRGAIVEKLKHLRPELVAEGVSHLALFGSRARGDNGDDSDLDLLLEVAPGSRFSILNLVGVGQIVAEATGLQANAFMRRSLEEDFRKAIEGETVEVF